jgi:hypothetical protein
MNREKKMSDCIIRHHRLSFIASFIALVLTGWIGGCDPTASELALDSRDITIAQRTDNLFPFCKSDPAIPWEQMTTLQKHVAFFDINGDGSISPLETYYAFRDLGFNPLISSGAMIGINALLGPPTGHFPTPYISIANITEGIHGSDADLYDEQDGNVSPEKFNTWFNRHDLNGDNALDVWEMLKRTRVEADVYDPLGLLATIGEFAALYLVAAENGKMSREKLFAQYDGSLFYRIAAARGTLRCRDMPPDSPRAEAHGASTP